MATKPKYYVTMVMDCPACEGSGGNYSDPCTDCRGTGTIKEPVELAEALAMIGIPPRLEQVEKVASRAAYQSDAMLNGGI